MVVKMMKWRPWPPLLSRKFKVKLVVKKMEGANSDPWKGPKITLGSFRRTTKRDFTIVAEIADPNGVVLWDQEFRSVCTLSGYKENDFLPWEIGFTVFIGSNTGVKNKVPSIGKAYLNIADFASFSNDNGKSEATSNFPR
ncbi:hypothetical protein LXL04_027257 [Taraxacum kok-saghyz]